MRKVFKTAVLVFLLAAFVHVGTAGAGLKATAPLPAAGIVGEITPDNGFVYNPSYNTLSKLRTAFDAVRNNTASTNIIWPGSSTAEGAFSGNGGSWVLANTLQGRLAHELENIYGINADSDSVFGFPSIGGSADGRAAGDTRLTFGAGWTSDTAYSIGGPMAINSTTTNAFDFVLPTTADRVDVYYAEDNTGTPLGTISWEINSAGATSINTGDEAPALKSVTITLTPGSNTLHLRRVSGTVKVVGVQPYLTTEASVHVINAGVSGTVAGAFNAGSKPYELPTAWAALAPSGMFVQQTNNDAVAGTVLATYKSNLTAFATAAPTADTVYIAQTPYGSSVAALTLLPPYVAAMKEVGLAIGAPVIDQTKRFLTYAEMSAYGFTKLDDLHLSPTGYRDQGSFLTEQVMAIAGQLSISKSRYTALKGFANLRETEIDFLANGTHIGRANSSGQWYVGSPDFLYNTALQPVLTASGTTLVNGTMGFQIAARSTVTGGAAGITSGIGLQFDDGNSLIRSAGGIWIQKNNSTLGNPAADLYLGARAAGSTVTVATFSPTSNLTTLAQPVSTPGVYSSGTDFTVAGSGGGCGTLGATTGGSTAGIFTTDNTGACQLTVTFGAVPAGTSGWACAASNRTTANLIRQTASTTTTATFAGVTVASDVLQVGPCTGF